MPMLALRPHMPTAAARPTSKPQKKCHDEAKQKVLAANETDGKQERTATLGTTLMMLRIPLYRRDFPRGRVLTVYETSAHANER